MVLGAKVSNQTASSSIFASNTVPILSLPSMAVTNGEALSNALPSAGATPRVRFQLDSIKSPADTDQSHNAPDFVDVKASPLSADPTPAQSSDAIGTVGMVQRSHGSEEIVSNSNKQEKAAADDSAVGVASSASVQSQKALIEGVHGASSVQKSVDLEKHGGVCSSQQLEDDLHQESCTDQTDCVANLSEQDHFAAIIKSMRRRITVADFQFAYAGYAARQGLNAVDK